MGRRTGERPEPHLLTLLFTIAAAPPIHHHTLCRTQLELHLTETSPLLKTEGRRFREGYKTRSNIQLGCSGGIPDLRRGCFHHTELPLHQGHY